MPHYFLRWCASACLIGALTPAYALSLAEAYADFQKAISEGKTTHVVDIDNDSMLLRRDDRFYTAGMRYTHQSSLGAPGQSIHYGWRLGQDLYTASSTQLVPAEISPHDHPYAGWLYGGFFKETLHADGSRLKLGVDLGCLGPCAGGEWTQIHLHRLLQQKLPRGWGSQVKNEAGLIVYGDVAWPRWAPVAWIDLIPSVQGRFGNIATDVMGGVTLRFGTLNVLPEQTTLHGLFRADVRAVAYNASLQGGYFSDRNPHTVKPKPLVGELEMGVVWNDGPYGLRASIVRRGNEIVGLSNAIGAQSFARVQIAYSP